MSRSVTVILLFSFIFSTNTFSSFKGAKVILLRGKVFFKSPPSNKKVYLQKGDRVPEGSTIWTLPKSMIKLLFRDKTTSILGPKSSLALTQTPEKSKDKVGVISLLKGKIRTKFVPNLLDPETGKSKLFIKTKTAAMGIRGTDFSAIYNPSLDLTTTVTFEGDVLLGKLNPEDSQVRGDIQKNRVQEAPPLEPQELQERLEKAVTDETAVSIKAGNFSSFNARSEKEGPSRPAILSPRQFKKLQKNETFKEAPPKEKKSLKKGKKFRPVVPPGMNPEVASAGEGAAKKFILKSIGKKALLETFNKKKTKSSKKKSQQKLPDFLSEKGKKKTKSTPKKKVKPAPKKKGPSKEKKSKSFKPGTIISPDGIPIEPPKGSQFDPASGTYIMPSFLFKLDSSGNPVFATEGLKMNEKGKIVRDKEPKKDENKKKKNPSKKPKKKDSKKTNPKKQKKTTSSDRESKEIDFKDVLKKVEKGIESGKVNFENDLKPVKSPNNKSKNKKTKNKNKQNKKGKNKKKNPEKGPDKGVSPPPAPPAPPPTSKPSPPKVNPPNIRFFIK